MPKSKDKDSWLFKAAAWATIISVVATIIGVLIAISETDQSKSSTTEGSGTVVETTAPASSKEIQVGMCLSATSPNISPISCQVPHSAEVFAKFGSCDKSTLITYLGGNSSIDIIRNDLIIHEEADGYCFVMFPPPLFLETSIQGALASSESARLRQCIDEVNGVEVNCQDKHTAEVVAIVDASEIQLIDCQDKATAYINRNPDALRTQLTVKKENTDIGFRCIIAAKTSNQLTGTLRLLGNSSVPISPY